MSKEIVKHNQAQEIIPVEQIKKYLTVMGLSGNLNEQEQEQFVEIARAYNLNPFKREIYCAAYTDKNGKRHLSIMIGFQVYLQRAETTGKLDGYKVYMQGNTRENISAVIEIYRKDWKHPYTHSVKMKEYYQEKKTIWVTKPETMLKKVVMAQGFRNCFPCEFSGMPYIEEELPDEMTTPVQQTQPENKKTKKPDNKNTITLAPDPLDDLDACANQGFQNADNKKKEIEEKAIKEFSGKSYIKNDVRISTILSYLFLDKNNHTKIYNKIMSLQSEDQIEILQLALKFYMMYPPVADYKSKGGFLFKDHLSKFINNTDFIILGDKLDKAYDILNQVTSNG